MRSPQLENLERIARVAGGAYDRPQAAAVVAEEVYDLLSKADCPHCDQVFLLSPLGEDSRSSAPQAVYVEAAAPPWRGGGRLRVGDIWDLGERAAHIFDRPFDHSDAAMQGGLSAQEASSLEPYGVFDRYLREVGLSNWRGLPLRAVGHDKPLGLLGVASFADLSPWETRGESGSSACPLDTITSAVAVAFGRILRLRRSYSPLATVVGARSDFKPPGDGIGGLEARPTDGLETGSSRLSDALRMQALTNMAFGISHSLANIFCAILGNLHSLSEGLEEPDLEARGGRREAANGGERGTATAKGTRPTAGELVAKLEESTYAGIDMMRSLQKFAGQPPHDLELVDLSELARDSLGLMEQLAGAWREPWRIVFRADLSEQELRPTLAEPDHPVPAWCSRGQIHEAVVNLVFNAIQATAASTETAGKGQGAIGNGVTTKSEGGEITIITRVERGYSRISVRDNGPGMTKEVHRRATEPFFTTHPGTHQGLGLSIARGIVVAHHGQLTIQSSPGEGSQVDIRLPQSPPLPLREGYGRRGQPQTPEEVISDVLSDLRTRKAEVVP